MNPAFLAPLVPLAKQVGGYLLIDQAIQNAPAIMKGANQFMMGDPSRNPNTIIRPKRDKPLPGVMGPFAAFDKFMFGSSPLENYRQKQPMYGTLPPSARVVTQYPEGVSTGVGGGNAAQAQSLDPNSPAGGYIPLSQPLPPSPEQIVEQTPIEKQLVQYEQGRGAAKTQAEMNQVRDVGLAIHKAHNPQLYSNFRAPMASDRTFNPLMANTFPDMYPQSREAFIKEGGVQMPQSMNNVDARTEIIEGNRLEGEQRAKRLTEELKAQEFMQRFLKMKGEEEAK